MADLLVRVYEIQEGIIVLTGGFEGLRDAVPSLVRLSVGSVWGR